MTTYDPYFPICAFLSCSTLTRHTGIPIWMEVSSFQIICFQSRLRTWLGSMWVNVWVITSQEKLGLMKKRGKVEPLTVCTILNRSWFHLSCFFGIRSYHEHFMNSLLLYVILLSPIQLETRIHVPSMVPHVEGSSVVVTAASWGSGWLAEYSNTFVWSQSPINVTNQPQGRRGTWNSFFLQSESSGGSSIIIQKQALITENGILMILWLWVWSPFLSFQHVLSVGDIPSSNQLTSCQIERFFSALETWLW